MDLIKDNVKTLYIRFLTAAFGSALATSIYGLVDMAMVGQYHGPEGSAAMAVVAPIWNIIYSLGLLTGIGGSVLFSVQRGKHISSESNDDYFSSAVILSIACSLFCLLGLWIFEEPLLRLFGADASLLLLSKRYLTTVKFTVPSFLFVQMLAAFLRNDSVPDLATKAVIIGGCFNIFGDYFFVFTLDMGILGAGLATSLGSLISLLVMCSHFFSKKCTLTFTLRLSHLTLWGSIIKTGFSAFFVDIAMGILTMLFNQQIMHYLGTSALAVYGVLVNISTFVQCCAYGVGQASQPILSQNFGAKQYDRIRLLLRYNLLSLLILGIFWTVSIMTVPNMFIRIFMVPTKEVLTIAPFIMRCYGSSFFFLLVNVYATYYFPSLLQPQTAMVISVSRGLVISGGLILCLPLLLGPNALWLAMLITETIVLLYVIFHMRASYR